MLSHDIRTVLLPQYFLTFICYFELFESGSFVEDATGLEFMQLSIIVGMKVFVILVSKF